MMRLQLVFLLLSVLLIISQTVTEDNSTLLLVQILFRHSDRAPTILYPNDPNSEEDWPNGLGKLTQLGKKQHYALGKFLRSMYKDFVTSNPNEVYVNSSGLQRCLESAEANLASLYAPEKDWMIEEDLKWQPIPIHYLPVVPDFYFNNARYCPRRQASYLELLSSEKMQNLYKKHQNLVKDVTVYSGLNYTEPGNALDLFDTLECERNHNLIIPDWAEFYWNEMSEIAYFQFQACYISTVSLKTTAGPILEILKKNLLDKMHKLTPDLKVVVSSSHDVEVAAVLLALNFTDMPRPPYCATLVFELHKMDDVSMAVRLLYLNSTNPLFDIEKPHILVLENCTEFCPVDYFIKRFEWLIPNNWDEECGINETADEKRV